MVSEYGSEIITCSHCGLKLPLYESHTEFTPILCIPCGIELEDAELAAIVKERENEPEIEVDLESI